MRTSSRNVALVLFDEVELLDVAGPLEVLSTAGRQWNFRPFKVHTVAAQRGLVETRNQVRIEARYTFEDCPAAEVLVVPGGYGARRALSDGRVVDFISKSGAGAEHVLGIGAGVLLLAKAGLLFDSEVAVSPDHENLLGELCSETRILTAEAVSTRSRVMTAKASAASLDLTLELIRKVLGEKQAAVISATIGHQPLRVQTGLVAPLEITGPYTKGR